jgi:putative ABC transport system substrate-binding protein
MKRREFIGLIGGAAAWPVAAGAQQSGTARVPRVAFLDPASAGNPLYERNLAAFREGLSALGYAEGKNLVLEVRWAEGSTERLTALAAELVASNVDVLVTHSTLGTLIAKRATATIPIVSALNQDAVANGIVDSLANPGGNVTGSSFFFPELMVKRLEFAREVLPRAARLGTLSSPDNPANSRMLQKLGIAAHSAKVTLDHFEARNAGEFEAAALAMAARQIDGLLVPEYPVYGAFGAQLTEALLKHSVPSFGWARYPAFGGVMGYGPNIPELFRRASFFVDRILKGSKPRDIPVEQPTKFDLVINSRTAKALGLTIPPTLLALADEVIE